MLTPVEIRIDAINLEKRINGGNQGDQLILRHTLLNIAMTEIKTNNTRMNYSF